jgi:hypothetical protein
LAHVGQLIGLAHAHLLSQLGETSVCGALHLRGYPVPLDVHPIWQENQGVAVACARCVRDSGRGAWGRVSGAP